MDGKRVTERKRENLWLISVDFSAVNIRHTDSCIDVFERTMIGPTLIGVGFLKKNGLVNIVHCILCTHFLVVFQFFIIQEPVFSGLV